MTLHIAACSCGQLTLTAAVDRVRVSVCHCLACQRRTGSVFGVQARFPKAGVTASGQSSVYVRTGDAGSTISLHFCPMCGATVYYALDSVPDFVGVPVGAFADPGFLAPAMSVYEERMHAWVTMPEHIEHIA